MIVPDRRGDSGASPRRVRGSLWAVVGVLACGSVLEPAACWRGGLFSVAASRIWMAGGALTAAAAVWHFLAALCDDFRQRKFLSLVFLAVLLSMLCALVGDLGTAELSFESTQQIAAGLRSFAAPDWNYTGKAFLGYPNRQYLVAALPSLALGRSVVALHLGYALPFLLGVMILFAGFRAYAAANSIDTNFAVLPPAMIVTFPILCEYYLIFEQTLLPVSLTMAAIGWFLLALERFGAIRILSLAWTLCFMADCYTPALASAALFTALLGLAARALLKNPSALPLKPDLPKPLAIAFSAIGASVACFTLATFLGGRGDRIFEVRDAGPLLASAWDGIRELFADHPVPFAGVLHPVVMAYVLLSLTSFLGKRNLVFALWVLAVFAASTAMKGYAVSVHVMVQRAMVTIPVLCAGICLTGAELFRETALRRADAIPNAVRVLAYILVLSTCLWTFSANTKRPNSSMISYNYTQPMKYIVSDLAEQVREHGLAPEDPFRLIFFTENTMLKNIRDYTAYFFPGARVELPEGRRIAPGALSGGPVFVYSERGPVAGADLAWREKRVRNGKRGDEIRFYRAAYGFPVRRE